jgi:hypothetical protein
MVELSGLHGVWVGSDHLCWSKMTLFYPEKPTVVITYELDKHAECARDAKILEEAKKEYEKTLANQASQTWSLTPPRMTSSICATSCIEGRTSLS